MTTIDKNRATVMATLRTRLTFPASTTRPTASADEELRIRVERALARTGYPQLRKIAVNVGGGSVTLSGSVSTYYLKQVAQCAAISVQDFCALENNIEVACGH